MKHRHLIPLLAGILLVSCSLANSQGTKSPSATATSQTLPTPVVQLNRPPDPQNTVKEFLDLWKAEDYAGMYAMLTRVSQDAISADDFARRYQNTALNLTLDTLDYELLGKITDPTSAQVAYQVNFHTNRLGELKRQMMMNMTLDNGQWKIQWDDALIMPELKGSNHLSLNVEQPARGNIYDRNGHALAAQDDVVALGVIPGEIDDAQADALVSELARLTGKTPEYIKSLYENQASSAYIAIGEASASAVSEREDVLSGLSGLVMSPYNARYYADGGIAPHVTGFVMPIFKENLDEYKRRGYSGDEKVGIFGLEQWGEQYLAGQPHLSLHVVDPNGIIVTALADQEAQPAQSIYTTIDKDLQEQAQKAIQGFTGAIVVLERDTGRVLAMVSSPGFDPNMLNADNRNFDPEEANYQFNRASQGTYPLGSVYKIITMSAGLESGLYSKDTTYNCQQTFEELPGDPLYDWTYEKGYPPSGMLTLPEGLMRSCNPYFYHIGLDLFRQKGPDELANMARAFGLGSLTGIEGIPEAAGNIEAPNTDIDAVQMAIGQYTVLVTPLQVADFVAAVGNGGTLYTPQVIEKIAPLDGDPTFTFTPKERGRLPVSAENLAIVQDAMRSVVADKRGTAFYTFSSLGIPVYGKTGTAQSDMLDPHAWFAGYTDAGRSDKPDIAIAVVVEYGGEGSEIAAPIFRRVVEDYFQGQPGRLYPWESSYYVTRTPTPLVTDTPVPEETETPTPEAGQ